MGYLISALAFFSCAALTFTLIPLLSEKFRESNRSRSEKLAAQMERALLGEDIKKKTVRLYILAPVLLGGAGFLFAPAEMRLFGLIGGLVLGFLTPSIYVQNLIKQNRSKFDNQLIDALMIMSSSFRGGLSLIQAMEAVAEEMSDPISSEFSMVLGENKMGVSLEEALNHLYQRMTSPSLQQMITAILLARETGGNLPSIFSRIVNSIREKRKIQQNIETLTLQGKIQGVVMSLLPIGFAFVIYSTNPHFLQNMLSTDTGRGLLIYAAISECIGAYLIWKISTFKDF
jgi:tight adherence protein B